MRYMLLLRGKLPVVSEITSHPLNVASAKLHEKFGFMPFCDLIRPSGLPTTMWLLGPDEPQAPAS
jgi:hypothetical protein